MPVSSVASNFGCARRRYKVSQELGVVCSVPPLTVRHLLGAQNSLGKFCLVSFFALISKR